MPITKNPTTRSSHVRRAARATAFAATLVFAVAGAQASQAPPPDNTKANARDGQPARPTADDQKNNRTDLQLTQEIRKAIVADKTLSTYAHNVKVIAQKGKITLRGPVRTADEKKAVEIKAAEVAGATNIINKLSVAPSADAKKAGS